MLDNTGGIHAAVSIWLGKSSWFSARCSVWLIENFHFNILNISAKKLKTEGTHSVQYFSSKNFLTTAVELLHYYYLCSESSLFMWPLHEDSEYRIGTWKYSKGWVLMVSMTNYLWNISEINDVNEIRAITLLVSFFETLATNRRFIYNHHKTIN